MLMVVIVVMLLLQLMYVSVASDASLLRLLWMVVMSVGDVVVVFVLLEELRANRPNGVLVLFGIIACPKDLLLLDTVPGIPEIAFEPHSSSFRMSILPGSITVHVVIVVEETVANAVGRRHQSTAGRADSRVGGFVLIDALVVVVVGCNHEHVVATAGRTVRRGWRVQAAITGRIVQIG